MWYASGRPAFFEADAAGFAAGGAPAAVSAVGVGAGVLGAGGTGTAPGAAGVLTGIALGAASGAGAGMCCLVTVPGGAVGLMRSTVVARVSAADTSAGGVSCCACWMLLVSGDGAF